MKNITRSVRLLYIISPLLTLLFGILTALSFFISPLFSLIDKFLFDTLQQGYNDGLNWKNILYIVILYFCYNFGVFMLFKIRDIVNTYTQTRVKASLKKKVIDKMSEIEYDRFEDNQFYNYITTIKNEIKRNT